MQDDMFDLRMKISKYEDILKEIASASDQANPKHLVDIAKRVLTFYAKDESEPTTADEFNAPHGSAMEESDYIENQAEIVEYDRKLSEAASEAAESAWRNTVLHPDYENEEE